MITFKLFDSIAQRAHFLLGVLIVLLPAFFHVGPWYVIAIFLGWAAWKEAWYDEKYETKEVRGSGWEDFLNYLFGVVVGISLVLIKTKLLH